MKIVLQKFIAESGFCSRRKAEELIKQSIGSKKPIVLVNERAPELGMKVDKNDDIKINGQRISLTKEKIYIKLNKPASYVCTNAQFKNEKNIFDIVKTKERLFVVGRLDKYSRGLVLLTNDGELTQKLTHPKFKHEKEYEVKIKAQMSDAKSEEIINYFKKGVDIGEEDGVVRVKGIKYLGENKFKIILTQGKKRQIRRMFTKISYEVTDLFRTAIVGLELGNLKEGQWEYLNNKEISAAFFGAGEKTKL